jgi:P4 family phage/plasmid primase-like protien
LKHEIRLGDVKQWAQDGANIGLKAEYYPAVDIDTLDSWLSAEVAQIARSVLGEAPSRVGHAPKQLLMYRTGTPFGRCAVRIRMEGKEHLVEVLGRGRQYLIYGQHPNGSRYTWDQNIETIAPNDLTWITYEQVEAFFLELQTLLELVPGITVERIGAKGADHEHTPQDTLLAPSLDALRACMAAIPNSNEIFPERDDYIKIGYAIRGAAGDEEDAAFAIWSEWCARWDGGTNDEQDMRNDWGRMKPPYSVGWTWLAEIGARCGFVSAQHEFQAGEAPSPPSADSVEEQPVYSDAWLVERVIEDHGHLLRYVPHLGRWYVWSNGRWAPDAILLADHTLGRTLRRYAGILMQRGTTVKERAAYEKVARGLCSASKHRDVRHLLRIDPRITAPIEAFDNDLWLLNTPGGLIDLRTAEMRDHDPAALCSRQTSVAPDSELDAPLWSAFLQETTAGNLALQDYLQRLAGYALTGCVHEQMLAFVWGPGGNGKSVFLNAIVGVLHDYAESAAMDTFTAASHDRHPTDLAGLVGARLVTATETQGGRRWDEQRIKTLTGGDPIKARYMRQDYFTYQPQFTLVFSGNHKPEIRDLDDAMRRRFHLVPFTATPEQVDTELGEKLRVEYPAILAWMVRGCLEWQARGLIPPEIVTAATQDYFAEEDPIGQWLDERTELDLNAWTPATTLFASWVEWAGERGEFAGSMKRFSQLLIARHFERRQGEHRRPGFVGLHVLDRVQGIISGG